MYRRWNTPNPFPFEYLKGLKTLIPSGPELRGAYSITNLMRPSCITIVFWYELQTDSISIDLIADVESVKDGGYLVKNIRKRLEVVESLIPAFVLQKLNGIWVHKDSGKETNLSDAVGKAIDQLKEENMEMGKIH